MSTYNTLEPSLNEILAAIKPLHDDRVTRFQIIDELRGLVQSLEILRGATVEPFGSFASNLYSHGADLDISIDLYSGSFISTAGKKHKLNLLRHLIKAMKQRGGWHKLQFIPNARVPILKVESNLQNISCDISIDNLQGQMKSKFLLWINDIDARFRDMVFLVKEWAKAHNINNPKTGTFNSYSLSLLVIFHFQTCVPAIFPPLKDIYPGNIADDLTGLRADAERHIAETCAVNILRFKSNKQRAVNRTSLSELFISFLEKFCDISLRAPNLGICTYKGQWEHIQSNTRWLPQTYALFIEDPFEQPANTARALSAKQLLRISEAFGLTYHRLISNLNRNTLLYTLVQQKTLQFISRAPVGNTSYTADQYQSNFPQLQRVDHLHLQNQSSNSILCQTTRLQRPRRGYLHSQNSSSNGNCHQPYPQVQMVRNSSSEVQPQFQNTRQEGYYSNASTRKPPLQTNFNQRQQMWRPRSDR
ncbi:hypothetical protein FNV43_RR24757 [Rhamnella rubrinervis]|uniref:Poly(A) RNA polymerase mitochondrial-like central palm domain-containing protein n=1 Tax=Rhamnella rubrinervis TaxID=2594499 RepID=A0A8K0DT70_9ROSA|nr:hypothetical protein FNV43_RR24757 [Rhamnella rubrinervis]